MIRLKVASIDLDHTHPRVWEAVWRAGEIWAQHGSPDCVITAAREQGHETNPDPTRQFHWLPDGTCQAVDIRTWSLPLSQRALAVADLRQALPDGFDVIYERAGEPGEHCHLEWDDRK